MLNYKPRGLSGGDSTVVMMVRISFMSISKQCLARESLTLSWSSASSAASSSLGSVKKGFNQMQISICFWLLW